MTSQPPPLVQSPFAAHPLPTAQPEHVPPPQSTSVSLPSFTPSVHVGPATPLSAPASAVDVSVADSASFVDAASFAGLASFVDASEGEFVGVVDGEPEQPALSATATTRATSAPPEKVRRRPMVEP